MQFKLDKTFSIKHLFAISIVVGFIVFFLTSFYKEKQFTQQIANSTGTIVEDGYKTKRVDGYKYIRPIMFVVDDSESEQLSDLKQRITSIIDKYKNVGEVNNASVYLKEYGNNYWITVNDDVKYDPGSLFKVPVLITILKMNELHPGFLNKSIKYSETVNAGKNIAFADKSIKLGNTYTIRELLTYMIKYSDNNATILLEKNMDSSVLQKLFKDIGLEVPNIYASQYLFNAKGYSYFMRIIYNAGYLSFEDSEFAGELLGESNFKDGILKGLPSNVRVAHKFGESGNQIEKQLHESALIYLNNKTYLLTIMTRGKDNANLSKLIAEISQLVYNEMNTKYISML